MVTSVLLEPDAAYFERREREEMLAARSANSRQAADVHLELAEAYGRLAWQAAPKTLLS